MSLDVVTKPICPSCRGGDLKMDASRCWCEVCGITIRLGGADFSHCPCCGHVEDHTWALEALPVAECPACQSPAVCHLFDPFEVKRDKALAARMMRLNNSPLNFACKVEPPTAVIEFRNGDESSTALVLSLSGSEKIRVTSSAFFVDGNPVSTVSLIECRLLFDRMMEFFGAARR